MTLKEYRRKRDFKKTREPSGTEKSHSAGKSIYLIQKHDASRLHYDFRLELDGVLKSWAVPKGPSLNPHDRRLAVQVEDHPLEYGDFEGTIPQGEYGGGTVMLWDRGTWEPEGDPHQGLAKGNLKFALKGKKLKGSWALVRMHSHNGDDKTNWLLIKEHDGSATDGDGQAILKKKVKSVASMRTLDQIAQDQDRVWSSRDAGKTKSGKKPSNKRGKTTRNTRDASADPAELTGAKAASLPSHLAPQLAKLRDKVPRGEQWLHEIKYDGYRMLCFLRGGQARLVTRNGKDWTSKFKEVARGCEKLGIDEGILDGEIVALRGDGVSDFQELQNRLKSKSNSPLVYYVFDLPFCAGYDLRRVPLSDRKRTLAALLRRAGSDPIRLSDHIAGDGGAVHAEACRRGLEGVVSKDAASHYVSRRGDSWVKVKCQKRQELVICGFTPPKGSRRGFGALLLGYYDQPDGNLIYAGKVGTGFDDEMLQSLHGRLTRIERKTSPYAEGPPRVDARHAHWVTPRMVGEISFTEWTREGRLRHPSFLGLREDKPADKVVREMPEETRAKNPSENANEKTNDKIAGVALTHPDRILFPEQKLTKRELAEYYVEMADRILPHVAGRPLTLVRCPQGRAAKCFYQKHVGETLPKPVRGVPVQEEDGERQPYIVIDDAAGIATLVQFGALEIHPWGARADRPDRPDVMIFDLDPDPAAPWSAVQDGARLLRDRLADLGLTSFLKTSGGKGLHVFVPIDLRSSWDVVKSVAHALADEIAAADPKRFLAKASKAARKGRVYIDYLRNARGATCAAAYTVRARAGAPVSTPLAWDELDGLKSANAYTVDNIKNRLAALKHDPWADYFSTRQSIAKSVLKGLGLDDRRKS